ncbi:hypothetical protein Taro_003773 [Colocasia esculenta]|uniref:Kinesin motor domain-containing protein n=1 Tax=Colocasia esculenta TaxID=4460 RepID=A0A843TMR4_COLES|nr:hypothetical protein [Colocasia esculenta]
MGAIAGDELMRWENAQEEGGGSYLGCRDGSIAEDFASGGGLRVVTCPSHGITGGGSNGGGGTVGGGSVEGKEERIRVSVRLRPLNAKELARNDPSDWECINDTTIIFRNSLPERSMFPTAYTFDRAFPCDSTTKKVYEEGAKEVALSVVSGINSSIFAYGQTSSGKTYTMTGITEYAMNDIYDYIDRHKERAFILKFSAIEIYNEAVRDLLSPESPPLRLLDDPERGTIVEKLTEETLRNWYHMKELLSICEAQRQIGETSLNETSSRSHQILRLTIESSASESLGKENSSALAASVNFVDLAGSERASQALSAGTRLKEGCHINRSLLTLGTVIRKLSKGRNGHIPYRDSKLTRILQSSLGGNARTAIICTLSPARSHVEQSRNALLFASCAKEVITSAQVNVVMSEKALVKHLQKELARLESELRLPGPTSSKFYAEVLLKEKDAQIQKLEKEIKELIHQRNLAQSRIQGLLRVVGDEQESRPWDGFVRLSSSHVPSTCEDDLSVNDSSYALDFDFFKSDASQSYACDNANYNIRYLEDSKNLNVHDAASPQNSVSSVNSILVPHGGRETISQDDSVDMDIVCKEVRCIEVDEISPSRSEQSNNVLTEGSVVGLSPSSICVNNPGDLERRTSLFPSSICDNNPGNLEPMTKLQGELDAGKGIDHFAKPCPVDSSPWPSVQALSSSRYLSLTRSRSCRAILMSNSPSLCFFEEEQYGNTPPSIFYKDFPGRPEKSQRRLFTLNYGEEIEVSSKDASQHSERISVDVCKGGNIKPDPQEHFLGTCDAVAKSAMDQIQFHKDLPDSQVVEANAGEETKTKSVEYIGTDPMIDLVESPPMINPMESPSPMINSRASPNLPQEFERQQKDMIELWHACNVSLLHRTYFFLLFKGDPADSIYMEVELRRLYFLKRVFTQGSVGRSMFENNCKITPASSMRALRRERVMLCRQMQKKLSAEERESLYGKWGIPLHSKQRKLQLSRLIWSETGDMDHIRESASLVAAVIGLAESDQALKEMFGLSFTPQITSRRSPSWKHGVPSFI